MEEGLAGRAVSEPLIPVPPITKECYNFTLISAILNQPKYFPLIFTNMGLDILIYLEDATNIDSAGLLPDRQRGRPTRSQTSATTATFSYYGRVFFTLIRGFAPEWLRCRRRDSSSGVDKLNHTPHSQISSALTNCCSRLAVCLWPKYSPPTCC